MAKIVVLSQGEPIGEIESEDLNTLGQITATVRIDKSKCSKELLEALRKGEKVVGSVCPERRVMEILD